MYLYTIFVCNFFFSIRSTKVNTFCEWNKEHHLSKPSIHIHHNELWKKMIIHHAPSTDENIQYGTTEMAEEVKMISEGRTNFYFVMKGHEDGIIIFAESMKLALDHTLELYHRYLS